jgi:hypothetical protein
MIRRATPDLANLFEADETAWLEQMSALIHEGRLDALDFGHLAEYLADMARRDKREVISRLTVLIAHRLKWEFQFEQRSKSWRTTIELQRQELAALFESAVLHQHALDNLAKAYANGVRQACSETGSEAAAFPAECPYSLDRLLAEEALDP